MIRPSSHRLGSALLFLLSLWLPVVAQAAADDAPRVLFTAAKLAELQARLAAGEPRA
ncbi:MAG: hypothetical protein H7067_03955, partial [Burkholderiales bacterium]|nr:hypothetical protein [Opitutaceae bacterium]